MNITPNLLARFSHEIYERPFAVGDHFDGFEIKYLVDNNGVFAVVAETETDIIVCIRGTEFTDWEDLKTNFDFKPEFKNLFGDMVEVHAGYFNASLKLLEFDPVIDIKKKIWVTGHSLGGAVGTFYAARLAARSYDVTLATFGAPQTHEMGFGQHCDNIGLVTYRYVNESDLIPELWFFLDHHYYPALTFVGDKWVESNGGFWKKIKLIIKLLFKNKKKVLEAHAHGTYVRNTKGLKF